MCAHHGVGVPCIKDVAIVPGQGNEFFLDGLARRVERLEQISGESDEVASFRQYV